MASTTRGWQCPVETTAMPAAKSRNTLPSTSSTIAPRPDLATKGYPRGYEGETNCASRAITSLALGPGRGVSKFGNLASLMIAPIDFSTEILQRAWLQWHDPDSAKRVHLSQGSWVCRSKERDQIPIYAEV